MKHMFILIAGWLLLFARIYSQAPDYTKIKIDHSVKCSAVKDQQYSSTCWSFAVVSFLESEIYRKQGIWYDLSEMYFARYSYINKVSAYLKSKGAIYFTPGRQFHDVMEVIKNKGVVLEDYYHGDPRGTGYYDHSILDTLVSRYTKSLLKLGKTGATNQDWKVYNNIFNTYLGEDINSFNYGGTSYIPQTFNTKVLGINPDDYIEITSYTHHPFYESFVLEDKYNWMGKNYYNVPLDDFMEITNNALLNGYSVCWDGDVTEKTFDYKQWSAYLDEGIKADQATRQQMYVDTISKIDHMMHIVGFGKDDKNETWYYVKNSWGKDGPNLGYICMSNNYFRLKTVAIIVHKDAIPLNIRTKMKL